MKQLIRVLRTTALACLLAMICLQATVQAQHLPGTNDPGFNSADVLNGKEGFNNTINSVVLQSDGRLLVLGNFTAYNGVNRNNIARLNADGTLDESFDPGTGFIGAVFAIALQSDGKLVVGGSFISYNGTLRNRIVRLHPNGALDQSFDPGAGFNGDVHAIAVQTDGKLVVAGGFTSYKAVSRTRIVRLHADGTLDESFHPGTGFNSQVYSVAIQEDGKVLALGSFTTFNGSARNKIARLNADGTLDEAFNIGAGLNSTVLGIALQDDGKLLVGGGFSFYNSTSRNYMARFNTDGTLDSSFNPGTGLKGAVVKMRPQPNGKLIAGVLTNKITNNIVTVHYSFVRLNPDGSLDNTFATSGDGFNNSTESIAMQSDGKLVVAGRFTSFNDTVRPYIARLNTDGSLENSFTTGTGFDNTVQAIALQPDGKAIVGGNFVSYNGSAFNRLVRLNTDGSPEISFTPKQGFNGAVHAIALQPDGKLVVGGLFTAFDNTPRYAIARLHANGALDETFNPGTGFSFIVLTIALQSDGKMIIGGNFSSFNGISCNRIVRLNANGSLDTSFNSGTGFNNQVRSVAIQSDGKIVVGGDFTLYNNGGSRRIIRLNTDGSRDVSFQTGIGFSNPVACLALDGDGKLVVGGWFDSYNGTSRSRIARLLPNGSLDSSFDPGTGFDPEDNNTGVAPSSAVKSITVQRDGKLVVGGDFTSYNRTLRSKITRLHQDGTLDIAFNTEGTGFDRAVTSIVILNDDKILAGGDFTTFSGIVRNRIARLHGGEGASLNTAKDMQAQPQVLVYPNPSQGDINLEFSGAAAMVGGAKLVLYNAMGRQVLSREVTAAEAQAGLKLATTGLAAGVYFLTISTRSGMVTKRVVLAE